MGDASSLARPRRSVQALSCCAPAPHGGFKNRSRRGEEADLGAKTLPPRYLGGYASGDTARTHPVISRSSRSETPNRCKDGLRAVDNLASMDGWHPRTSRWAAAREQREESDSPKATPQQHREFSNMRDGSPRP